MINGLKTFGALSQTAQETLKTIKKLKTAPDFKKTLRTFSTAEATQMIGRNKSSLHEAEKTGKLEKPLYTERGKRMVKKYTLEHINAARDFFGTRIQKPINAEAAIIAVASFKGGGTKTTTAKNTAHGFALKGLRVLLIDDDHQGTCTYGHGIIPDFDLEPKDTLYPYLVGETEDFSSLIKTTYWSGLDIIPANLSLYNAEFTLPSMNTIAKLKTAIPELDSLMKKHNITEHTNIPDGPFFTRLDEGLKQIKNNYDVVIIDCPPSLGVLTMNAIYAANGIIIPLILDLDNYASFAQFLKMMEDVHEYFPEKTYAFINILISRFKKMPKNRKLHDNKLDLLQIVKHYFSGFINETEIPESEVIGKASIDMLNLFEIGPYPDKTTLNRILTPVKTANHEIFEEILAFWNQTNQNAKTSSQGKP